MHCRDHTCHVGLVTAIGQGSEGRERQGHHAGSSADSCGPHATLCEFGKHFTHQACVADPCSADEQVDATSLDSRGDLGSLRVSPDQWPRAHHRFRVLNALGILPNKLVNRSLV